MARESRDADTVEAAKDLVRRHFEEIFNRQNLDACDETMAEDFVEHAQAPFGQTEPGRVHGPSAMRSTAEWLFKQFPDLHMTIEAIVAEGDMVAVWSFQKAPTWASSTACFRPPESASSRARVTGIGSRMESWSSTGPRGKICPP